jgi:hypothetical protein
MQTTAGKHLRALLDAFEQRELPFDEFARHFSDTYTESSDLNDEELTLYGPVHEKLEWTSAAPPPEDRAWGWVDPSEFRAWLYSYLHHPM